MSKKVRTAVRTVVLNEKNEILLINAIKGKYYHLPGGGVNSAIETPKETAIRETLEETGYLVEIIAELGTFEEHSEETTHRSFGYLTRIMSQKNKALDNDETDFVNVWFNKEIAKNIVSELLVKHKGGKFESFFARDYEFLTRAIVLFECIL